MLLADPASTADYPPAGSDITSLQEAYNQAADGDNIRTKAKIYSESLLLDRPISIDLQGGYTDTTYTTTSGVTSLYGTLMIKNGTVRVSNLAVGGSGGGLTISAISVTMPRIAWTTDQLADSRVDYGETTSYGMSVSGTDLSTSHSLVITGLKPNTTYHYIVSSSTSSASTATVDSTFTTSDFIAATVADIGNSTVIEVAGGFDTTNSDSSINFVPRQKVAQEYYKTHNDDIDFLVIFSTFDYAMPDADTQGVYMPVKNDTIGINQAVFDNSTYYGSNSKLRGTIDMGNVSVLAAIPYGEQLNQTLTVLSHEFAHRFGAYVRYKLPDNLLSTALLGKDNSHWSYLLDSQGSVMYGNGWSDNSDGTFTSIAKQNAFSQLDLYLLGMIPKEQVPPMLLINNPSIDATQLPFLGATISGTATTVTINDIVAAEGDRVPSSTTSPKQFNIGFVLLTRAGDNVGSSAQAIETLRKGFAGRFAELTQGIGSIANVPDSLEVTINTPTTDAIVTGPSVQVTGAVINTTGVETGVTVNGIPATVNGSQFVANNIQLQQGVNTITATATDINARTSTVTKTVTAQLGNYIRLTANTESGTAPLNSTITISGSFSITNSELNYSGPADILLTDDYTVTDYPLQFPVEGTYILTAYVAGPDGLVYEDSVTITVLPKLATDRLFRNKWNLLTGSLVRNDPATALNTILTTARPKYQNMFDALSGQFSAIVSTQQALNRVSITNKRAKYELVTQENGSLYSYDVFFVREDNGLWAVSEF